MKTNFTKILSLLTALACLTSFCANAQSITVTGAVSDAADGSPLTGCCIQVKGTKTFTTADANGKYSIQTEKGKTLVFSYVGFQTKEVKITQTVHNVALEASLAQLEEVIATGHAWSAKRYKTTASSQSIMVADYSLRYIPAPQESREEYDRHSENKFFNALNNPLSTFSIDVDAASYGTMRRFINNGQLPQKGTIRSEEMINYFDYGYPAPTGKTPVNVITEIAECPWNTQHRLVHIGLKAKEIAKENLPAANLVFLIDVSGSMEQANKLPLVKQSLKMLVNNLRDKDRVAIVVYAGAAGEVLPSTSGDNKTKIIEALENLQTGGSTAGGAGIKLAYKIAKSNFIKDGNNRVILATDGDFNVGVSSNADLENLIEEERKSGVFLTVLGYGMGNYKDSKMQALAQKGNGNHAYIDNLNEAQKVLVNEFGGTLFTIAKDVKVQVEFNPAKVQAYRLIGYESRLLNSEDFNDDTKDAGEMGAGQTVTALYEVVPAGVKSNYAGSIDDLKYQQTNSTEKNTLTGSKELLTVKIRYKAPDGDASSKIEVPIIDTQTALNKTSDNFRFSAAVAEYGMLLNDSPFKAQATFEQVISLASGAYGEDKDGYRREFVRLVKAAKEMKK